MARSIFGFPSTFTEGNFGSSLGSRQRTQSTQQPPRGAQSPQEPSKHGPRDAQKPPKSHPSWLFLAPSLLFLAPPGSWGSPRQARDGSIWAQTSPSPREASDRSRHTPNKFKQAQDSPKTAPDRRKMSQGRPKTGARWPKMAEDRSKRGTG